MRFFNFAPEQKPLFYPYSVQEERIMYFNRESVIVLKKSGLSVREISKKTGISKTTVGRWLQESDKVIVSHCPVCGKEITYTRGHRPKKFCSDKCCIKWWREHNEIKAKRYLHTCEHCGKPFKSMKKYQRFCCRECYLDEVCGK